MFDLCESMPEQMKRVGWMVESRRGRIAPYNEWQNWPRTTDYQAFMAKQKFSELSFCDSSFENMEKAGLARCVPVYIEDRGR